MMEHKILVLERSSGLANQVVEAIDEIASGIEVVPCTRVGSAAQVIEEEGPFSIIVAGPSLATHAGLKRLAAMRKDLTGASFVLAFDQRPDASLREIVQVGAVDLLMMPVDQAALRQALKRGMAMAEIQPTNAGAEASPAAPGAHVYTVCSATGGCGKTFMATNLAQFIADNSDAKVVLVDLDLQFGEITTALRLKPPYTIVDAVQGDGDGEDGIESHIDDYLVRYRDNFWTLAAPLEPSQADEITAEDTGRILDALRARFDYIIVDTPTALAETVLTAFDVSEHLFVIATLDLPSVRNMSIFLQTLGRLQIPQERTSLMLNKVERDIGIDPSQIAKHFPQGFIATLPYAKEVSRSINSGEPVITYAPNAAVSTKMCDALAQFLPPEAQEAYHAAKANERGKQRGVLSRFLKRDRVAAPSGG